MSTRRERAKAQNLQLNKQLESKVTMPKERREQVVELGKFFIDLAKLMEIKNRKYGISIYLFSHKRFGSCWHYLASD